jgi:hypothetical protein
LQRLNEGQRVHVLALSPDGGIDAAVPEERLARVLP